MDSCKRSQQANFLRSAVTNRCTSPAWSKPADTVILVHLAYLQLNGEINMLENPEKKIVNCSAMYLWEMKEIL